MIRLTAFRALPPFAQGLARDFRVRWALEEAGMPYEVRLIGPDDQASAAYRALQPFGQVPAIETGELKLFESGAIVLYIAEKSEALAPSDANGLARTKAWMFAALNSIEPAVQKVAENTRGVGGAVVPKDALLGDSSSDFDAGESRDFTEDLVQARVGR